MAAQRGFPTLTRLLLSKGSNPNLQTLFKTDDSDLFRQTPLHLAILAGQSEVIEALLTDGKPTIDLDVKNSEGKKISFWSEREA